MLGEALKGLDTALNNREQVPKRKHDLRDGGWFGFLDHEDNICTGEKCSVVENVGCETQDTGCMWGQWKMQGVENARGGKCKLSIGNTGWTVEMLVNIQKIQCYTNKARRSTYFWSVPSRCNLLRDFVHNFRIKSRLKVWFHDDEILCEDEIQGEDKCRFITVCIVILFATVVKSEAGIVRVKLPYMVACCW